MSFGGVRMPQADGAPGEQRARPSSNEVKVAGSARVLMAFEQGEHLVAQWERTSQERDRIGVTGGKRDGLVVELVQGVWACVGRFGPGAELGRLVGRGHDDL